MNMTKQLSDLDEVIATQCSDGNWNYNAYMHGMANGLLLAKGIMEDKSPEFLDAPEKWLCDTESREPIV